MEEYISAGPCFSVGGSTVEEAVSMYRAILHSDGKVFLMFPIIVQSTCKLDVR